MGHSGHYFVLKWFNKTDRDRSFTWNTHSISRGRCAVR